MQLVNLEKEKNLLSIVQVKEKVLSKLFISYLELVHKTSSIYYDNKEIDFKNSIIGFWHGDSYSMNLLIKDLGKLLDDVDVVVTADERGNYIESVLKRYGGNALRMPDGVKMKSFLKELKVISKKNNGILAVALDGPVGPYHEPKKIASLLSNESSKKLVIINIKYSRKITLHNRWDKYKLPLPFSKITINLSNLGEISKERLKNYILIKEEIINTL